MTTMVRMAAAVGLAASLLGAPRADAVDYMGTVQFEGLIDFAAPIPGITESDVEIGVRESTEATGNGEKCTVQATTSDDADGLGAYPDAGTVSATILLERGGPNIPDGDCVLTIQARGSDGVSVSARGSQTVFVSAAQINASATVVVPTITLRESKAVADLDKECITWVKKQLKARAKCNFLLLKKGPTAAAKCTDAGPEPANCDPGDFIDTILALSAGDNDQQTNPMAAEGVDVALKDQVNCQKRFGKAAVNFANKRIKLVQKLCIDQATDTEDCRAARSKEAKKKLDQIDKCAVDQATDGGTGRIVPAVGVPCEGCIDGGGVIDRKCLKACFQITLDELTDGIIGDLPECGDGILQPGEFCDDGNTTGGDCCSATCTVEAGSTEGPMGDGTCSDLLDNDCDTLVDGADPSCN